MMNDETGIRLGAHEVDATNTIDSDNHHNHWDTVTIAVTPGLSITGLQRRIWGVRTHVGVSRVD